MGKVKIKYTASFHDSSGYGSAARNYLCALAQHPEVELSAQAANFELFKTDIGKYEETLNKYLGKSIDHEFNIIHLTPENFPKYIDKNKKVINIGYTVWETTKLPEHWVKLINENLDYVFVPCFWNKTLFEENGIKIPVIRIPHTVSVSDMLRMADEAPKVNFNIPEGKFAFYSIAQFTERKNIIGLLKAYFSEFSSKDNVALVLKTYVKEHKAAERDFIRQEIQKVRQGLHLGDNSAPVVFIGGSLSSEQMVSLHKSCDALVLPTRAEGFSLTPIESFVFDRPTISTGFGGSLDFMNNDNSYLIDYNMTVVYGMWSLYSGRGEWAEPDLSHLKKLMRHVYENQDEAKAKAKQAKKDVYAFSWENIGDLIVNTLKEIGAKR